MSERNDRDMLIECSGAFLAMETAAKARKFMKGLGLVPGAYAGDGRHLLAKEMFRLISEHRFPTVGAEVGAGETENANQ